MAQQGVARQYGQLMADNLGHAVPQWLLDDCDTLTAKQVAGTAPLMTPEEHLSFLSARVGHHMDFVNRT